jgi:hypothetical protein
MEYSKTEKRALRLLLAEAHRRELTGALKRLHKEFGLWESGDIDSFELNERIHHYHQNEARAIWSRYNIAQPSPMIVADVIQSGLMTLEEVPDVFREQVAKALQALSET